MALVFHGYWRAGAPYRVRIALKLKGVDYVDAPVDLLAGEQHAPAYRALNPQGLTPALETPDGVLTQSLAILEWLEETYPTPPLLPADSAGRAVVRAMAGIVACDIHPLNNLRVQKQLSAFGLTEERRTEWSHRWIADGFGALEPMITRHGRGFAYGDSPTMADCCLISQVHGAQRVGFDMTPFPTITAVAAKAAGHPAFAAAHPDRQPEARKAS